MIYIFIGGSRAGKSSIIKNSFMQGKLSHKKDILPYCESEKAIILGNYKKDITRTGLDSISRTQINDIVPQVLKLYRTSKKDIVLDGDKATSKTVYDELLKAGCQIKTVWMKVSPKVSIERSRVNGIPTGASHLKALCTKAQNIYWKYHEQTDGLIIETDNIEDFAKIKLDDYKDHIQQKGILDDFAIFILTHGRANHMYTLKALQNANYTGKWYMIIDDEDETADEYYRLYGDHVVMFEKQPVVDRTDTMDLMEEHKAIVYVRNESFRIARDLGLKYFMMLDDDDTSFLLRYEKNGKLVGPPIKNFNKVCEAMVDFLLSTNALTVAICQGGDYIGGKNNKNYHKGILRKVMNSFVCRADRPIKFRGTMNEDVVTYTTLGSRGELMLSYVGFCLCPRQSQTVEGGMTEVYLDSGTYLKSFYSVMSMPSCVKIGRIKDSYARIHHNITWNYCVPKILNERWQKK